MVNLIVIDQFGLFVLASDSAIKAQYHGNVKQYSHLVLREINWVSTNSQCSPHDNESSKVPNFTLIALNVQILFTS